MRVYSVHVQVYSQASDRDARFVREGFAWPAFAFTIAWALWHRLWVFALLIAIALGALALAQDILGLHPAAHAMVSLGLSALIGFEAHDWLRAKLARRGFVELGPVAAKDRDEAERQFFATP
jgi:hypothetical protein